MKGLLKLVLVAGILLVGCQGAAEPEIAAVATATAEVVAEATETAAPPTATATATPLPTETSAPTATATLEPTQTPSPTATATAEPPTETPLPANESEEVSYNGVSFTLSPAVAGEVTVDESGRFGDLAFLLVAGEPCQSSLGRGDIALTSIVAEIPWYLEDPVQMIEEAIATGTAAAGLPMWGANKVVEAQLAPLSFQNGSGFRSVLAGAQNLYPITNETLLYRFYGLTADGRYWVSVCFPVDAVGLPAAPADKSEGLILPYEPPEGDTAAQDAYTLAYNKEVQTYLNTLDETAFTPQLSELDAVVQSLIIERD